MTLRRLLSLLHNERGSIAPPPGPPVVETPPPTPEPASLLTPAPKVEAPIDWKVTLPDDLRASPELGKYKTLEEMAKGHVEQAKLVGRKALAPPDKDSTPEQVAAWRKALNVPEDPSGYFTAGVKLPEIAADPSWNKDVEKHLLTEMHKLHATPAQVQTVLSIYGSMEAEKRDSAVKETQAASQELRRELGANYDASLGRANRAIQEFGGGDLVARYDSTGMGRDPVNVRAWIKVGNALVESGAMTTEGLDQGLGPEEAREKIVDLRKEMAKLPEGSPRTKELVDQVIALTRVIHK